jgi:hypothetical protein
MVDFSYILVRNMGLVFVNFDSELKIQVISTALLIIVNLFY